MTFRELINYLSAYTAGFFALWYGFSFLPKYNAGQIELLDIGLNLLLWYIPAVVVMMALVVLLSRFLKSDPKDFEELEDERDYRIIQKADAYMFRALGAGLALSWLGLVIIDADQSVWMHSVLMLGAGVIFVRGLAVGWVYRFGA